MAEHTITFSLDPVQRADTIALAKSYGIKTSEYIRFCLVQQARRELKKRDIRFLNNPLDVREDSQFVLPGQLELEVRG
jgi:hypothetical protein